MQDFEKLGLFYLGKTYDLDAGLQDELLLYDAKDLTTHAVCVGMTGSGKTGLCLSLIEEALIDQVPVIAIDPKGDLGNLLLTFPELSAEQFRPWIDEGSATRAGMSADEFATRTAQLWRDGLQKWGQGPERIAKLRETVDMAIYTPGSSAGLPLTVLKSFDAPGAAVREDGDAMRERISGTVSGLLALLGIEADPVRSREHILISNILDRVWREGRGIDIAGLIMEVQQPPFEKVGVFDLETFYPSKDRIGLAMEMNNLLASPSFQSWMTGEPLDVKRLLHTPEGKPRLSIISIAHLSDSERMFFVTILLNEIVAWVRAQEGTSTLRAMLYMDEVYGYFPPVANPPSKTPMLTLLKQARAFGLGVVLATQNPVDLDYKGLSNTGTWFLGRLQTERDKARVLEGLEGASAQAGANFDRQRMEATLAGLGSRVFLMNNVHEDQPVVFQTRWAMSYLRGPLSREHISRLMQQRKRESESKEESKTENQTESKDKVEPRQPLREPRPAAVDRLPAAAAETGPELEPTVPPPPPEGLEARFVPPDSAPAGAGILYRPALLGEVRLHFIRSTYDVDQWESHRLLATLEGQPLETPWEHARPLTTDQLKLSVEPWEGGQYEQLPPELPSASALRRTLEDYCHKQLTRHVWRCESPKTYSHLAEPEGDFRVRLRVAVRELRDQQVEKLRDSYQSRTRKLMDRLKSAQDAVAREQSQYDAAKLDTAVSIGDTLLGVLFGRKLTRRASSTIRRAGEAAHQKGDIGQALQRVQELESERRELERELERETAEIEDQVSADAVPLERLELRPRKGDIEVGLLAIVWLPWLMDGQGGQSPSFELDSK